ncbi:PLP-dependent cysteine synthase family protein [Nonomuraea rubra]
MIYDNVLGAVGRTPLVRLRHLTPGNGTEVLIKLEAFNPGGSVKDRAASFMIDQAERHGHLKPGATIIESTSGNLGKALALIGATRGYRVILVVDPMVPRSTLAFANALGAEIDMVEIPDAQGSFQTVRYARVQRLIREIPDAYWPDQYNNPDNPRAHAQGTAYELLEDVGEFDALIVAVSTGGQISGLGSTLRPLLPRLTIVGVDAIGSSAFGFPYADHAMRGLGLAWQPRNLNLDVVDRVHLIADHEGMATCRLLARAEGLLVGESAGAAVFAALHHAHHYPGRIVVVAADGGTQYLEDVFDDVWLTTSGIAEKIAETGLTDVSRLIAAAREPSRPSLPVARRDVGADSALERTEE